jgi:transcriptional regulator with XRE-family HTH domain
MQRRNKVHLREPGVELKSLREARGWSLRAAADEIGTDQGTLSKIERGRWVRMDVSLAIRIRDAFGIDLERWNRAAA